MTSDEKQQLQDAQKNQTDRAKRETSQRGQVSNEAANVQNVYYLGITGMTTAEQGKELQRVMGAYDQLKTGTGGNSR
jgi:hypothetical protein